MSELTRMNTSPNFIFKQSTGDQNLAPKPFGGRLVFCQQVSQRNGSIEINQRSLRSRSKSRMRSRSNITGFRGGGPPDGMLGGVIQPCRTASASTASANIGLRLFWGGDNSATTRSRSVTSTVSPCSASRTYSLSLFFSTFRPTALIKSNVASGSYLCQVSRCRDTDR